MLRTDSIPKVTGAARYVEDMVMPGTLHGGVLRSPHHHARLISLNIEPATRMPGVVAVLTADDIAGENGLGDYSQEEPVLCPVGATVRMVGAPVALVVAETPAALKAGLAAIEVGYEILPHVFETDEALAPGATHIAGRGDNVLTSFAVQHGDLDAAFADSAAIVEAEYRTAFLEHSALERETLLGYYDEEGRLTVTGGNHEPFYQQKYIANALALPLDRVRVIMPPTGGSFGGKQDPWPFIATALMTQAVRRPVRLIYSRTESFDATPKRHPYVVRSKIGATADGRLTGIRVRIDANTGGYDAGGQYIPNYAVTASGGPYHWQAVDAYAQTVYTNGPKAGQYRGFGTAQSAFAAECALDELAEKLGIDPLELRLKNTLRTGETSFLGYPVAETIGFTQVLEALRPHYEAYLADADAFNRISLSTCFLVYQFTNYQSTNLPIYRPPRRRPRRHVVPLRQIRHAADRGARRAGAGRPFHHLLHRGRLRPGDEHRGLADGRRDAGRAADAHRSDQRRHCARPGQRHPGRIAGHLFRRRGGDRRGAGAEGRDPGHGCRAAGSRPPSRCDCRQID